MSSRAFFVYVVELAPIPGQAPRARGKPEVYVGSSALHPRARLEKHKAGGQGTSGHVRRRALRLLPGLARSLRRSGYRVKGGCTPSSKGCLL